MDLIRQLSDDQLALLGCAGALAAAFTIMAVSYHVGRIVRGGVQPQHVMRIESPTAPLSVAKPGARRAA